MTHGQGRFASTIKVVKFVIRKEIIRVFLRVEGDLAFMKG